MKKKAILAIGIIALFIGMAFLPAGTSLQVNPTKTVKTETTDDPEVLEASQFRYIGWVKDDFKEITCGVDDKECTRVTAVLVVVIPLDPLFRVLWIERNEVITIGEPLKNIRMRASLIIGDYFINVFDF